MFVIKTTKTHTIYNSRSDVTNMVHGGYAPIAVAFIGYI